MSKPLLEQAAAMLARCAAERTQRDLLLIEKWNLQVEADEFFRLDALHDRERLAGLDTLPYERAVLETGAEGSLEENHRNAGLQRKALLQDLLASGFNKRMAARELSAWISGYPLKDHDLPATTLPTLSTAPGAASPITCSRQRAWRRTKPLGSGPLR
jgi:hypothetical protein